LYLELLENLLVLLETLQLLERLVPLCYLELLLVHQYYLEPLEPLLCLGLLENLLVLLETLQLLERLVPLCYLELLLVHQ
jgi:hypothetical protein